MEQQRGRVSVAMHIRVACRALSISLTLVLSCICKSATGLIYYNKFDKNDGMRSLNRGTLGELRKDINK